MHLTQFSLGLTRPRTVGLDEEIANLFAQGETGAWYDPSDFSTLFQDSVGTTPVTAVEQTVGLMLDKSKGFSYGANLVVNGTFSDSSWWGYIAANITIANGVASFNGPTNAIAIYKDNLLTIGEWYKVTAKISNYSSGSLRVGNNISAIEITGNGTFTKFFQATATRFSVQNVGTPVLDLDNVTCQKISGNHAYQATSTARPVLKARYNKLTYSEQFDNAAWSGNTTATISANTTETTDPLGGNTADKLVEAATSASHYVRAASTTSVTNGAVYSLSIYAKKGTRDYFSISQNNTNRTWFNLATGVVATTDINHIASIESIGNGWYRCSVKFTAAATTIQPYFYLNTADAETTYTGTTANYGYIWGAQLNDGATATKYQRIAASTDYDTVGFLPYLKFDGSDDRIGPASLALGATWSHVGGWDNDGAYSKYPWSSASDIFGSPLGISGKYQWHDSTSTAGTPVTVDITTGSIDVPHVQTIQKASLTSLSGRYNAGGSSGSITPYDDSALTRGLALGTGKTGSFSAGAECKFYGGFWIARALSIAERFAAETWAALKSGVTL